ncbi:MAG: hypothetical protein P1U36_10425 [Legionellaceae bacterium]|nr:hypothetical protein [Legionellaceae bacterium]
MFFAALHKGLLPLDPAVQMKLDKKRRAKQLFALRLSKDQNKVDNLGQNRGLLDFMPNLMLG